MRLLLFASAFVVLPCRLSAGAETEQEIPALLERWIEVSTAPDAGPEAHELLDRLERAPRPALLGAIASSSWRAAPSRDRRALVELLGRTAGREDLRLMVELAGSSSGDAELEEAFARALDALLGREPRVFEDLARVLPDARLPIGSRIIAAAVATERPEALSLLCEGLVHAPALRATLLSHIARAARHVPRPIDPHVCATVREHLAAEDPAIVRAAVLAVAGVEDDSSAGELVPLLGHPDPRVREAAHFALKELTGRPFEADPQQWSTWWYAEVEWFATRAPELYRALESRNPGTVAAALNELSARRLDEHRLAQRVALVLARPEPELRRRACEALGQLGSTAAQMDLLLALEDRDPAVRQQALKALRAVTKIDLPLNPGAWRERLSPAH